MTVLVIGASGAIGSACVMTAKKSFPVIAADLKPSVLGEVKTYKIDVSQLDSVTEVIHEINKSSPLTGVIYAAGLNTTGYLDAVDWQDYERVMSVNLRGAFYVGSMLLRLSRQEKRAINSVFISSTAGLVGEPGGTVYCASKFGLIGFVQSFAGEISQFGGRSNVVCPGNVESPMLLDLATKIGLRDGRSGEQVIDQWKEASSLKRLIRPDEVAETCVWLLSPGSSGICGQTFIVDGART